jgi:DNA-binding GntR family transcriptional regulator
MPGGASIKCAQEHIDIARAVRGKDRHLAGELAASHVAHVMTNVLAAFPGPPAEPEPEEAESR